jgi:adenylate cyclase
VNLASRLEGLCPQYGVGVAVSGETRMRCSEDFAFQQLDTLRVKGKMQPMAVFTVLPLEEGERRRVELETWREAFAAYTQGRFKVAGEMAEALSREFSDRPLLYQVYAQRCRSLAANPPREWDGIWTMTAK